MLLIPLHKKLDWKKPPLVTLLLIVLNVLIFSLFQLDDDEQVYEAINYYHDQGLATIELPAIKEYLKHTGESELAYELNSVADSEYPYWVLSLQTNTEFMQALESGEVVREDLEGYDEWREKRQYFNELYESVTFVQYGLRTAKPSVITLFSHMFLHADFWHLFGNMLFLFIVGFLVEATLDSKSYLLSYIAMGLGSALFDFIFRSGELVPGIGASGAISGLMWAYAVLYGMSRIRFFYFIGFYFDYVRMPAIVLLPLWIGNEAMQMVLNPTSSVNFLAHIGGLCSGALIAVVIKRKLPSFDPQHVETDDKEERIAALLQQARDLMKRMKPVEAQPILRKLRTLSPDNREVLTRYYECCRIKPASDEYHALSHAIFALADIDTGTDELVRETFNEYLKLARPTTRISPTLACMLAHRFTRQKAMEEAERLVRVILTKKINCPQGHKLLLRFTELLQELGSEEKRQSYLKMIPKKDAS